ncbi:hypothetical protein [Frigoriglobus tundricola]|uniref:Uncharacterized protein n=1 Tax=Frigoriglobus tundricola TaxID=2774151 RepID=A0A6M5Z464_9BACT|nr:hypothetical protein [Frigoriglobus tundricola]QJX00515.1 hypothetical protein FTUN_8145 [Frigoriglobus tundricola]
MSQKHHGGPGQVPAGNRPRAGANYTPDNDTEPSEVQKDGEVPAQEKDRKRRLGDYTGTGEHSIQEPGGKNGANH